MLSKRALLVVGTAGLLALPAAHAESGAIDRGRVMADSCLTCHGSEGKGPGPMPSIAGLTKQGLINRMTAFRDRDTDATIMNRHAAGYTDEEIRAIAAHIAGSD